MIGSGEEARALGPIYLIIADGEVPEVAVGECGCARCVTRWCQVALGHAEHAPQQVGLGGGE